MAETPSGESRPRSRPRAGDRPPLAAVPEDDAGLPGQERLAPQQIRPRNGGTDPERLSDVDEWGRSQRLRDLLARLYDPVYDHWFRVEWEGFERIPREGGALIVANHAGAIPADAPSIMHGIERELGRAVYGLAD